MPPEGKSPPLTALPASPSELLSTKLAIPQPRLPLVQREALSARLDEGLRGPYKLSLILAPAGFGKTILVSTWVAAQRATGAPSRVAWVSLDAGDSDPARFWRYVISACQAFLLEHLPAAVHVVLTTRSEPALPLARLRARQQLNELRPADLQFSLAETRAFLEQAVPLPLSPQAVERLAARTEGWAAGLRLVALALQGLETPAALEQFVSTFGGSHRPILEYLATEVLAGQPARSRISCSRPAG